MTIARILVPVRGDGKGEHVLAHAAALARRFGAHVETVHCRARARDFMPYGVSVPGRLRGQIEEAASRFAESEEAHLVGLFSDLMGRLGLERVALEDAPVDRPTASWSEVDGRMLDVIRVRGRLADLTAVARPDRDLNIGENSLKAAIFQTGRPVLMCPPAAPPEDFAAHVAIAWNGALEATRAVAMTTPLLRGADRVSVLDGGAEHERIGGDALVTYLGQHGVAAERRAIDARHDPGRAILRGAREAGASLILCGAYGHSREHETIFGGATQTLIDRADRAVLMVH